MSKPTEKQLDNASDKMAELLDPYPDLYAKMMLIEADDPDKVTKIMDIVRRAGTRRNTPKPV